MLCQDAPVYQLKNKSSWEQNLPFNCHSALELMDIYSFMWPSWTTVQLNSRKTETSDNKGLPIVLRAKIIQLLHNSLMRKHVNCSSKLFGEPSFSRRKKIKNQTCPFFSLQSQMSIFHPGAAVWQQRWGWTRAMQPVKMIFYYCCIFCCSQFTYLESEIL